MQTPFLIASASGREVWSLWDPSAMVYELFTSPECNECIGHADSRLEAKRIALEYLND